MNSVYCYPKFNELSISSCQYYFINNPSLTKNHSMLIKVWHLVSDRIASYKTIKDMNI